MVSFRNCHVFFPPIESHWKELSSGILVDIWVQSFGTNHPFPHQDPGIAASNRFWPSPPRNSYYPQFGSTSAITIPLVYSMCGPSLGMVSTFSFEQIMHNCHQFDCIITSHCTRTTFCKMTTLMTTSNGSTVIAHQPTIGWKQPCLWLTLLCSQSSTSKDFTFIMSPKIEVRLLQDIIRVQQGKWQSCCILC